MPVVYRRRVAAWGITIRPGDRLLTLSTCAYHTANGRFLVVARQVD